MADNDEETPSYLERIGRTFIDGLATMVNGIGAAWWEYVILPLLDRIAAIWPKITPLEDSAWEGLLKWIEDAKIMDRSSAERILRFKGLPFPVQSLFNTIIIAGFLGNYVKNVATAAIAPSVQNINTELSPNLPDPATLIHTAFIAPEKTAEIRNILRRLGYSEKHIDLMFIANYQLYDVLTVRDLYLRKEIDEFKAHERLEEMGFTKERIMEMKKLWDIIPPVQDILMMVAKEAFEPDEIEKYGLGSEFPEEQSEWLTKMGLSRYWQEKYWAAHWDYPSFGQVITCLQRGALKPDGKPFTADDVYDYYRVIEIPPFWRHMMTQIQYIPYTRVDTRRMHAMGVLTDDELVRAYTDQGYNEEKAGKMAEFTIAYNQDAMKKLTQSQVIKAYRNKLLTPDEVHALLEPLKFRSEHVDFLLASEDFEETMDIQAIYLKTIHDRFTNLLTDELQARNDLGKLNLPGRQIDALMEKWNTEKIIETKLPSKTDLDKFLRNGIINKDAYRNEMYRLGYSWDYVNWYTQLVEMKKAG